MLTMMLLAANPGEVVAIVTMGLGSMYVGLKLLQPIAQGIGRRLGGEKGAADPALQGELDDLRARVHELEGQQARMLELEERLDFTERLLTRQRDAARLTDG